MHDCWRVIDPQPVMSQASHGFAEPLEVHWLDDATVDAQLVTLNDVADSSGCESRQPGSVGSASPYLTAMLAKLEDVVLFAE